MAENNGFFNSKEKDRIYHAKDWADYFFPLFKSGVFNGGLQAVENGGMSIKIKPGYAWIDGYYYHLRDDMALDLETASGNMNRMDSIVIRLDLTNRWIKAFCKTGGSYAGAAVPPAPEITATIHEIVIAHISVAAGVTGITQDMITDTRMDKDICGWVCGTVEEIDFSQITAQFNRFFANYKENILTQYETYLRDIGVMKETAGKYYDDFAKLANEKYQGFLLEMETCMDGLQETGSGRVEQVVIALSAYEAQMQAEFDQWFGNVKDKLSEDAAGGLQKQIGQLPQLETQAKENLVAAVNELHGRNLNTIGEIRDNTDPGKTVGALAFKEYLDGTGVPLAEPTEASVINRDEAAQIRWTDPQDITNGAETVAEWEGTLLVRKAGSPPAGKTDGVILLDSKTRDAYKDTGFTDNGLTNGETYYYGIFPYTALKSYTYGCVKEVTPQIIYPPAVSDVQVVEENAKLTITFTKDSTVTEVKCVYKTGSAPESAEDGTVITDFTSGTDITGLINDTTYYFRLYTYNAKHRETAGEAYSATPFALKIVTWANGTDAQLAAMLEAHYAGTINIHDYWRVGDERKVNLSAMAKGAAGETHAAQTVTMVLMNSGGKALSPTINGKKECAFVVGQKNCLADGTKIESGYMNPSDTNSGGWDQSKRRTWCNETYRDALPETFRALFKQHKNAAATGSGSVWKDSLDYFALPSEREIFGSVKYANSTVEDANKQFTYYKTSANRIKKKGDSGSAYGWWERSPYSGSSTRFCGVYSDGSVDHYVASNTIGIAPFGCI